MSDNQSTMSLDFSHPPFKYLTPDEKAQFIQNLDIQHFAQDECIFEADQSVEHFYIVKQGLIGETDPNDVDNDMLSHYIAEDCFGALAIINGLSHHQFCALEDSQCYSLERSHFIRLISHNHEFAQFFRQRLANKARLWNRSSSSRDTNSFMISQIDSDCMRKAVVVPAQTSIEQAFKQMRSSKQDSLLVLLDERYGMLTGSDLLKALIEQGASIADSVGAYAHYKLITVDRGDFLFNALVLMTRHNIERIAVLEPSPGPASNSKQLAGIVELSDILSFFSSHSHVIGLQIERASSIAQLRRAAKELNKLIASLIDLGVRMPFAMDLLAALNARIMAKLYRQIMPAEILANSCLLVLGSEGRGEQILKTDQDNALILADGFEHPKLAALLDTFSQTLISFGFPACPGQVMVNNPKWVKTQQSWQQALSQHFSTPSPESMLDLAIIVDAHPIAGNKKLFKAWQHELLQQAPGQQLCMRQLAKAVLEFNTPLNFFGHLKGGSEGLDIKKGGIFPLVHGLRTLALEQGISATNSFKRITALNELGILEQSSAENISEALSLFVELRLKQQMKRMQHPEPSQLSPNHLELGKLNRLERDLLREALQVVKEFKATIKRHFCLDA